MRVDVVSGEMVRIDLEYQSNGLSEVNIKELIKLLETAFLKMRKIREKEKNDERQVNLPFVKSMA